VSIQKGSPGIAILLLFFALLPGCSSVPSGLRHDVEGIAGSVHIDEYKPSLSYRMLITGVKLSGYKKNYEDDAEKVIANTQKYNSGLKQHPPENFYRRFVVTETTINDRRCFLITPKQNAGTDKVVVFLHGGAFMLGIDFYHWNVIEYILTELSVPVWVPLYPIYPETNPNTLISFIDEVFAQIYAAYPAAKIIGLGDSSGACLLLSYCHYLSEANAARFPDHIVLVSPAQVIGIDEATLDEMHAIGKIDPVISIDILKNLPLIFNLNDDGKSWFNTPLNGDFSRFPLVSVFIGTHDIFYPLINPFAERMRSQGKTIELYTGIGMMHSWPYMPVASESRYALDTILEIIRKD